MSGDNLALHDREVDLDLVQPTRAARRVDGDEIGPARLQPRITFRAAMRRPIVGDPEDSTGRPIRLLRHHLLDEAIKGRNAVTGLATAKDARLGWDRLTNGDLLKAAEVTGAIVVLGKGSWPLNQREASRDRQRG